MSNLIRGISENGGVVFCGVDSTEIVRTAEKLHTTSATCSAALGRLLTGVSLMGAMLKDDGDSITLRVSGGGPAGVVIACTDAHGNVKGCIDHPLVELPAKENGHLDVGGAVGKDGFLTVSKDLGLKEPCVGQTALVSGEIAEDLAYYYLQSEQQPTIVYLSVWVDIDTSVLRAGGLVISPMPGASEETLSFIESRLFEIQNYALMLMQYSPEEAVRKIFRDGKIELTREQEPKYICNCSRERFSQGILSLGREEIEQMLKEDGQAEVVCQFCNKQYLFRAEDLQKLLEETSE